MVRVTRSRAHEVLLEKLVRCVYFAMAFSLGVELLSMRATAKRAKPVVE
ncbi:MAG: hypothetical protein AB1486_20295 [Planctomycetota bacterium]